MTELRKPVPWLPLAFFRLDTRAQPEYNVNYDKTHKERFLNEFLQW